MGKPSTSSNATGSGQYDHVAPNSSGYKTICASDSHPPVEPPESQRRRGALQDERDPSGGFFLGTDQQPPPVLAPGADRGDQPAGVGVDYPKPGTIGPDRLANAIAAKEHFGGPAVVVDFGTAVTFDVVNAKGNYVGGIIAPGLAAMTDYLHEKTALLPKIKIREVKSAIGKSTEQAMLIGAVQGYRGLVRELIGELKHELRAKNLPVVATGGYAKLIATKLPEISAVRPDLTLEGLRLVWQAHARLVVLK